VGLSGLAVWGVVFGCLVGFGVFSFWVGFVGFLLFCLSVLLLPLGSLSAVNFERCSSAVPPMFFSFPSSRILGAISETGL